MRLYRAVTQAELDDLRANGGRFRDSPHQSGEKGFFLEETSARDFAKQAESAYGLAHFVVSTEAGVSALAGSREHNAALEGRGVYLLVSNLNLLAPAVEVGTDESR